VTGGESATFCIGGVWETRAEQHEKSESLSSRGQYIGLFGLTERVQLPPDALEQQTKPIRKDTPMHLDTLMSLQSALITAATRIGNERIEIREPGGLRLIAHDVDSSLDEAYMDLRDHTDDGPNTLLSLGSMLRILGRSVEMTRTVDGITQPVDLINHAVPVWLHEPQIEKLRQFAESRQITISHAASLFILSGLQISNWN